VQSSFDGSDWSIERLAHLNQALTVKVKRYQRLAVEFSKPIQSSTNMHGSFRR
jgi:hypothetical protein